jgi:hypothetical protein
MAYCTSGRINDLAERAASVFQNREALAYRIPQILRI